MKNNILSFIDFDRVNTLLEGFNQTTGFVTAILDLEGNVLSKSGWRQICTDFHRINPETAKNCTVSDTVLANKMIDGEKYHFYRCLNGLVDVAVPLVIRGNHVGNLFSGQFFFEKPEFEFFEKQAKKYGFDKRSYLNALEKVPIISQKEVKTAMDFLLNMTEMISEMTFQKLEQIALNEQKKENEKALRISDERLKLALDSVSDAVWDWRVDTGEVYFSSRWYTMLGYNPYELPQEFETWRRLLHPDDLPDSEKKVYRHLEYAEPFEMEFRMRTKDNQWRWILARGKTVERNDQGKAVRMLGTHVDITERKKMEVIIQETQKMESIGNLAGGIAHDFNNILFPIVGNSEMLIEDLTEGTLEYENAKEILRAGKRGSDLVKQILAFSRQSEHQIIPTRIQKILKEVLKLSRSTIPSDIEINQDIQKDCGLIMADPTQIHQVAMNLITNALHAVEANRGTISIGLKEEVLHTSNGFNSAVEPVKHAVLSVSDTGEGIPPQVVHRIFEPYFTTKQRGKGTGLGLAVVHGIIREHGGDIKVSTETGRGTTFNVYIPLMKRTDTYEIVENGEDIPVGNERILLVDDEESIAKIEKQMLERLGYQVTSQTSSLDAVEVFRTDPDIFDIVITDMTMPNMTGDDLAKEILSIKPNTPIIICTGFSERIDKKQAETIGIKGFLLKPVVKSDMAQMVREVLDESK